MTTKLLTYTPAIECYECGQRELILKSFLLVGEHHFCCEDCRDKRYFECSNCNEYFDLDDKFLDSNGKIFCQDCYDDLYFCCDECSNEHEKNNDEHWVNDFMLCDDCYNHTYYECVGCSTPLKKTSHSYYEVNGDIYCPTCFEANCTVCRGCEELILNNDAETINDDSYCSTCAREKHTSRKQSSKTFDKTFGIKTYYGIEIECCSSEEISTSGIGYTEVDSDGSIEPDDEDDKSNELRLGVLQGDAGIKTLEDVCLKLRRYEAYVNKSTGLHIHIDATSITERKLDCLKSMAYVFDNVIFSLMPMSRRRNTYCKALPVNFKGSQDSFRALSDRYHGFNLESLDKHSTIEFRYHSGTTAFLKIYHWLMFCLHFVQYGQDFFWTCNQLLPSYGRLKMLMAHIKLPKETQDYYLERYLKFNPRDTSIEIEERQFQEVS